MSPDSAQGLDAHIVVQHGDLALDVELDVDAGRTSALLGPNGAGKSTVLAVLAGLVHLDQGHVRLDGRTLANAALGVHVPSADRHIGLVFQDGLLFDHLSVLDNVAFGLVSRGISRQEAARSAAAWLERVGMARQATRGPRELSGGESQRVALARALATAPDILLLDEPLAAVDVSARAALRHTIADHLNEFAGPRVLVTHDPTEAFLLADTIHVLEGGRLTQVGTPEQIRLHPRTAYAADLAGINLLHGVARAGLVDVGGHHLRVAGTVDGPVMLTIHPRAIALHAEQPSGSPRNTWPTTVERVEDLGDRVRVLLGSPTRLTVEITPGAVDALRVGPGASIWPAIKATEITVTPQAAP